LAAAKADVHSERPGVGFACMGLGVACILGTLVEPVAHHRRPSSSAIRAAIFFNVASSLVLTAAGFRYAASRKSIES
jgi:hypothetical protein